MSVRILQGDALTVLATLPAESVQVVCTSPPYFALRSYLAADHDEKASEIGSEPTPDAFVATMVTVFREVRRVLRRDGICVVNLGISYAGSGKGPTGKNGLGNHEVRQGFVGSQPGSGGRPYGTSGKRRSDCRDGGSSSTSLCDGCAEVSDSLRTSRTDGLPARESIPCDAVPSRDHMASRCPSPDSSDSVHPSERGQSDRATHGQPLASGPAVEQPLASQVSSFDESSQLPRDACSHCANCGACLSVLRSPSRDSRACARGEYRHDIAAQFGPLVAGSSDRELSYTASGESPYVQEDYTRFKPKDLIPIPFMVAMAMQRDGWYLRSICPWIKRSAMPESVTDRPSSAIEYLFLFARSPRYFWDAEAIRVPALQPVGETRATGQHKVHDPSGNGASYKTTLGTNQGAASRSYRNSDPFFATWQGLMLDENDDPLVLVVNPQPSRLAHYASYPASLVEPFVKAGTSKKGACPACGAPWVRETESNYRKHRPSGGQTSRIERGNKVHDGGYGGWGTFGTNLRKEVTTTGWAPGCTCDAGEPVPCVVLDPFLGSGTTAMVADRLQRDAIGIELSPEYAEMARQRLQRDAGPMFSDQIVVAS